MRTPIVPGREPPSQAKRRAGFGTTSVYGPGSSAPSDPLRRAAQLRQALDAALEVADDERGRLLLDAGPSAR